MDDVPIPPAGLTARLEALGIRRRDAIAGAAVVAGIIVVALLLFARDAPAIVAPPASTAAAPSPGGAPSAAGAPVLVHVAGFVRAPGLYELPTGARVADAIAAAGGARDAGDLDAVNLAQVVTDGLKVEVPRRGAAPAPSASSTAAAGGGAVSLNSADASVLESIPGIGPVKAAAIVQYRTENGAFTSLDQLLEVSGIGPATLESIRPYVTL
ncbi:MAG: ComEA family DNA-binding protein [Actinomycetota bacterium]